MRSSVIVKTQMSHRCSDEVKLAKHFVDARLPGAKNAPAGSSGCRGGSFSGAVSMQDLRRISHLRGEQCRVHAYNAPKPR